MALIDAYLRNARWQTTTRAIAGFTVGTVITATVGLHTVLAAAGVVFLANMPISWLTARYQLDRPHWSPLTWRIRRRWYAPNRPVHVAGTAVGITRGWDDTAGVIWVLVQTWPHGDYETRTEWRPLTDLGPYTP